MVNIVVTIYDPITKSSYKFTDNNFKSIKFSNQLLDTSFDINPTAIEQYATIVFKDKNGTISKLVADGKLGNDMEVWIYVDENHDFMYLTSSWEVQAQSTTITLQCNDPLKTLENKQTQLLELSSARTLKELFDYAFQWAGYSYDFIDDETKYIAENTYLFDNYVQYMDLLTFIKKLCVVAFFRVYWHKDKFIIAGCL